MADAATALDQAAADIALTKSAREVLDRAVGITRDRGSDSPSSLDVLKGLLETKSTLAGEAIKVLGADPRAIEESLATPDPAADPGPSLRQLLVNANREAEVLGHYQVDSVHLLLALLYSDSRPTALPLAAAGITLYDVRRHVQTGATPEQPVQVVATAPGPGLFDRRPDAALRRRPLPSLRGVLSISPVFLAILGAVAISGVALWTNVVPAAAGPLTLVFVTSGWIASVCIHEFAHALTAYLGGDRSVVASGYLTLDPLRYTNLLLSIIMPIIFLLIGGIGLPGGAVYINHSALRSRWWDSLVSLAGPMGTAVCAIIVSLPFFVPGHLGWITTNNRGFFGALAFLAFIEVIALLLNLLPIPGLDGFGIIRPWLPYSMQDMAVRFGQIAIIGLFFALFYLPAVRDTFFLTAEQLTVTLGVDPGLIFIGHQQMKLF